jgi:iron complex transport system substrate-binding protein
MIGEALGRPEAAERLVDRVESQVEQAAREHPSLEGTSFVFATFDLKDTSKIGYYTPLDNRPQVLEDLGMVNAPVVERLSEGSQEFWKTISAERAASLDSDVIAFYGETPGDEATIAKHPLLGQVPAIRSGARIPLVDKTDALTMSAPSPLALPWFLDEVLPTIAEAADTARAG